MDTEKLSFVNDVSIVKAWEAFQGLYCLLQRNITRLRGNCLITALDIDLQN